MTRYLSLRRLLRADAARSPLHSGLRTYGGFRVALALFQYVFVLGIAWLSASRGPLWAGLALATCTLGSTALLPLASRGATAMARANTLSLLCLVDLASITLFLAMTGGPSNPFSVLYLLHVALVAMLLPGRRPWAFMILSSLCYGALFFWHLPLPAELGGHDMSLAAAPMPAGEHAHHAHMNHAAAPEADTSAFSAHLQGMWLAFTLASALLVALVERLMRELQRERTQRERSERLLSMTTLAANAAHELATPLATIRICSGELRHLIQQEPGAIEQMLDETRLIDEETSRARAILDRMALQAGQLRGENLERLTVHEFALRLEQRLGKPVQARVEVVCEEGSRARVVCWPSEALLTALLQLIKNAHEAQAQTIQVSFAARGEHQVSLRVEDDGHGLPEPVREHLGEPFFTTKETGLGMGLGVFLARSLFERLGGSLQFVTPPTRQGCVVAMTLPGEVDVRES